METMQRVIHRSGLLSRLPSVLLCLALLLLVHALIRQNLPDRLTHGWPWRLELLDSQSAVAAVLATGGVSLARAQYARTVRPALGYIGRVQGGYAPHDQLAWACHLINSSSDVALTSEVSYRISYTPVAQAKGAQDSLEWVEHQAAVASIVASGLLSREDFALNSVKPGWPLAGQQLLFLGWFTEKAMRDLDHVFVRVRVQDRVGDIHERVIDLLKAAIRSPSHPDPPLV
ncbi:hypothetical protein ACIP79_05935 [Streptomyces sp. NPDC088747]|uniref:hypothetical protein n=1 Tax=Streptomyces sp. NPDC088747 TaxID=3365886 RepID=UPI00382E5ECD